MAIYDVTDLHVYNKSLGLLSSVYRLVNQIPESHQKLKIQIIRSAESIPPQIAEGFAKRSSSKEFKRYLTIAMGSSDETLTHAREIYLLSKMFKRIDQKLCQTIGEEYKVISRQLNTLIHKWIDYK